MKRFFNKLSNLILPIYWGGQGFLLCFTKTKWFVIIGIILLFISILKCFIHNRQYNGFFWVCSVIYVATSKKSNASYLAIDKALNDVKTKYTGEIPMHIRNAPIEQMKNLGYHEGYLYPHDFPGHYVEQQYLPDEMLGTKYYIKDENIE